jgi:hypothetical protein
MSEDVLGRLRGDLAVMQRAMGLHLSFGKGMLVFGSLLTLAAVGAAIVSLLVENDWHQLTPLAAIMVVGYVGLFLRSRCTANLSPEITMQVVLSVTIYAVVWIAACGYTLATFLGPTVGAARTALLHATSIGTLVAFTLILVRSALRSRERYYCLGLAISTLLAGMLLPILDRHYSYPLAHGFMAVGYLTGVAIQWVQMREAVANHAAD